MITYEPLPLYEAFSFLTGIANDFSIEEFFEAMYIKHISKAAECTGYHTLVISSG